MKSSAPISRGFCLSADAFQIVSLCVCVEEGGRGGDGLCSHV